MMKYFLQFSFILLVGWLTQHYTAWWVIAIIGGLAAFLFHKKKWTSFIIGFLAGGLLFGGYAFLLDLQNNHLLSERIGQLFGSLSSNTLLFITAAIGGLITGLGAWTGSAVRYLFSGQTHM